MDQMLSYCGSSTFEQSTCDSGDNLFAFNQEFVDDEFSINKVVDHNYYTKQINTLMTQCEQYRSVIKRQEKEIVDYRRHVESLEDDYSRITSSLLDSEKKIKNYKEKIDYFEKTVNSLENELDLANSRISFQELKKSSDHISFSNEIDFKFDDSHVDLSTQSKFVLETEELIKPNNKKLIITLNHFCKQNIEMKIQIDRLKEEVDRLKKDNEEYRTLLWNSKDDFNTDRSKDFRVSTPNQNFISYQSLNVCNNNSFSVDEDFEGENMIYDENFKHLNSISNEIKQLNENALYMSKINDYGFIENEEMPSKIVKDESTNLSMIRCSTYLFTDSMKKTISREISSIEDQKMPTSDFDSTIVTDVNDSVREDLCNNQTIKYDHLPDESSIDFDDKLCHNQVPISGYFFFFLFTSYLRNSRLCSKTIDFRLLLMALVVIFLAISIKYCRLNIETRIIPYYSMQEIMIDVLNQFCT